MSSAVPSGYFHNGKPEAWGHQAPQTLVSRPVKKICGIEIRGEATIVDWVGGINKHNRQPLQGQLMFARDMDGNILFWLQGKETNYLLLDYNEQPVRNQLDATERARELITEGAATDLLPLSDSYLNTQAKASNRPARYVADADSWLSLGAYGSVELGKARLDCYVRTRHTYYKVPDHIDKTDRVAIAQWVIQAIEHGGISTKALYPIILPNSIVSKNPHSNNNIGKDRVPPSEPPRPGSVNFKPLSPPECWLGTDYGQVILGTSTDFPGRFIIKAKEDNYYWVPDDLSQSRDSIRAWVEDAIKNKAITTALYPNPAHANTPERDPKDLRIFYPTERRIVDEEYGGKFVITSPVAPEKQLTDDFTFRIQLWRGDALFFRPFRPKEELFECKVISTLGRPGCDIKSKWIFPTEKVPVLHTMLKRIHGKIEFESSGAVRYVNGQVVGQGAISIKLNISNPKPGSLIRLVVGLEFPQFSAQMMPMIQTILPNLTKLYTLLTNPPQDRAEFVRQFDAVASKVLIPVTMLGGQLSLVYPANNAIKNGLTKSSKVAALNGYTVLAGILRAAGFGLGALEATTGFNIRVGYTKTLRDPMAKIESGNYVQGSNPNLLLVGKNPDGAIETATRLQFARQWFGERFIDPTLASYARSLHEKGFNAFQVATLIPLEQDKTRIDKLAPDPEAALLSPPNFVPQRLKYDPLMQLADQLALAVIDIKSRLPANALISTPRIFNSYQEASQAVQQILEVIRSYGLNDQQTNLQIRFIKSLINPYGVDWGIPQVRALNREKYGISAPSQKLTEQLQASENTRYRVTGTPDDRPEIITKRDSPEKPYVFSIWQDKFNGRNFDQKQHIGLVNPNNPAGLQKSLNQTLQ